MEITADIDRIVDEGDRFARAAAAGPLDARVPTCPDWDVAELVRHLGVVHLWAAANVGFPDPDGVDARTLADLADFWPDLAGDDPATETLVDWYRATNARLVQTLRAAPPDLECYAFLPAPSPLAMWARRQANEIAVHRYDAEAAREIDSRYDPPAAADGLDEMLTGFALRPRSVPIAAPRRVHVHATDVDQRWMMTMRPEGNETERDAPADGADLRLTGTAAELFLLMWNRTTADTVETSGDVSLLDAWRESYSIRWS